VLYFTRELQYEEETAIAFFAYLTSLAYISPLLGALLADGSFGRYQTILWFGWIYFIGLVILTIGAYNNGQENLRLQRILTFTGLFWVCIATGGIKPCVSAFGADQIAHMEEEQEQQQSALDEEGAKQQYPEESRNQESALSASSSSSHHSIDSSSPERSEKVRNFFAFFYFCINLGAVSSISVIPMLRHYFGFGAAFLAPTLFVLLAMGAFLSNRKSYVHHVPGSDGGSLTMTFRLCTWLIRERLSKKAWVVRLCPCIRPKRSPIGSMESTVNLEEEDEDDNGEENDGIMRTDQKRLHQQQLSDAKQALHVLPIMAMFPAFWMLYDQQGSVWTLQATRMKLHGLQPEQLNVVNPVEIMIFIPFFDRLVYPFLEQRGWKLTHVRRMRWGMVLTSVSFFVSGLLETHIQRSDPTSVSVFWQLPQISIMAIAEIFLSVTGLEFAYATSPDRMKALLMSLYLLATAVGDFFGGILYSTIFATLNRATVMHVCAVLMLGNLGLFCWVSRGWVTHHAAVEEEGDTDGAPTYLEMTTTEPILLQKTSNGNDELSSITTPRRRSRGEESQEEHVID
jgi:dipeptide/tripeptide permease